jgi:hypothetical protein
MKRGKQMKVYYKHSFEGVTVPAIIQNGSYFYIDMPVFENGVFDSWKRHSLDELEQQLDKHWLVTAIPEGKSIRIHQLGDYNIIEAEWAHSPASYVKYIHDTVKAMNAEMVGLFKESAGQQKKWDERKVGFIAHDKPYKIDGKYKFGYDRISGDSSKLFRRDGAGWVLASIVAYADGSLSLDGETMLSIEDVERLFVAGELAGEVDGEFTLIILNFATLSVANNYQVGSAEKLKEIKNIVNIMTGKEDLLDTCRKLYLEFLQGPHEALRKQLRTAYEAIPEHERMFLGDMDTKDNDYQRIIYHPEWKREV